MLSDLPIRIFGVVSVLLSLFAIGYILYVGERDVTKSVSHHAANVAHKQYYIFGVLLTLSIVSLSAFVYAWLIPNYQLTSLFSVLVGVALCLEIITTWIRLTSGWRRVFHEVCSYGTALLLPVLLALVLRSPNIESVPYYICATSIFLMILFLFLFVFVKSTHARYLVFQTSYVSLFYISILSLTVFRQ